MNPNSTEKAKTEAKYGFESELRTVNGKLLTCLNDDVSTQIITKMLSIAGVQLVTPHDIINLHILPVYPIF